MHEQLTDWFTFLIALANETFLATASHCPQWQVIVHSANGILYTGSNNETRVLTLALKAAFLAGTISILLATIILHKRRKD